MNIFTAIRRVVFVLVCVQPAKVLSGTVFESVNQTLGRIEQGATLYMSDLPGMKSIELPSVLHDFLGTIQVDQSHLVVQGNGTVVIQETIVWDKFYLKVVASVLPSLVARVEIVLPDGFTISKMFPALSKFDMFLCKNMRLMIVSQDEKDAAGKIVFEQGANLVGSLLLSGPLQYVALLLGYWNGEVIFSGHIARGIIGSSFSAMLPGKIQFFGGFTASNPQLVINIEDTAALFGLPMCSVEAGIDIEWPGQLPVALNSTIELHAHKATLAGSLDGKIKNIFGVYGLHAGNWKVGGSIDYKALVGLGGLIPLSDFLMQFELGFGLRSVQMTSSFDLDDPSQGLAMAFEGTLEGGLSINECVDFVGSIIEDSPNIDQGIKEFKDNVEGYVPNFQLGDVHVLFSPQESDIAGRKFTRGLVIDGQGRLFGSDARLLIDVQEKGFKLFGSLEEIKWGPVTITGPGLDRVMDTPDDGLILDAELSLDKHYCFLAGLVKVDIFGGISDQIKIDISQAGIKFETNKKILNLFDCGLLFTAHLDTSLIPHDFYVKGYMYQTALSSLQQMLSSTARTMAKSKMAWYQKNKASLSSLFTNAYNGFWNFLANMVGNTFNITECTFESGLDQLVGKMVLPRVTIKGVILGKTFELNDFEFDLNNPISSAQQIVQLASQLFE